MTPIAIIQDNRQFISALPAIIEKEGSFHFTRIYYCMQDALQGLKKNPADIVVLDVYNPPGETMDMMRRLKYKSPAAKWLVYTTHHDDETIVTALHAGANGFLLKDGQHITFINALHELERGGAPMSPCIVHRLLTYFRKMPKKENNSNKLSEREKEILHFTSRGLLYKEIGIKLGIQRETVKKHLARIYDKLQVQNKMEAVNKFYGL
jgi:DNA-binding NarL/FixJ family response regulator